MNEAQPFFSVIVPCCDIEQYAQDMFNSVHSQTFPDFECILVVERSKDNTLAICNELAAKDSRFRVAVQERSGSPAAPRNTGLKMAKGRYAFFLDGDDWLPHDALELLNREIQAHDFPELVQAAAEEWLEDANGNKTFHELHYNYREEDSGKIMTGTEAVILQSNLKQYPFPLSQLSVCRIDFLLENNLFFVHGLKHEDEEWTPRVLFTAPHVLPLKHNIYFYRRREGSITTKSLKSDLKSLASVARHKFHFCATHEIPYSVRFAWQKTWLSSIFYDFFAKKSIEKQHTNLERLAALRHWLKGKNRGEFRMFAQYTTLPKRIGMFLMLLCTASHKFRSLFPCDLYFRMIYYPLVNFRARRAKQA